MTQIPNEPDLLQDPDVASPLMWLQESILSIRKISDDELQAVDGPPP